MLARLPRPLAILFALLLAASSIWCLTTHPPPIKVAKKGGYTDVRLYHDMTKAVAGGQEYHHAAADLHRKHNYPLKPFFTVRLPTLVWLAAAVGWASTQKIAWGLAFAGVMAWVLALEGHVHWSERLLAGLAVGLGAGTVADRGLLALHEYWGGFFIAIALAGVVGWPKRWFWIVLPAAVGLLFRELTLPFVLLALAFALYERRVKEVAAWLAVLLVFALYMAWHAQSVYALLRPGDMTSVGWHAMQGFSGFLKAVIFTSALQPLPLPLALLAAMLPLVGWLALQGRAGTFCALLWIGYAVMISAFSRPDTFYWGAIVLPGYFAGFALLPRALWQLWGAIKGRRPRRR